MRTAVYFPELRIRDAVVSAFPGVSEALNSQTPATVSATATSIIRFDHREQNTAPSRRPTYKITTIEA
jgi:hypothetical protein